MPEDSIDYNVMVEEGSWKAIKSICFTGTIINLPANENMASSDSTFNIGFFATDSSIS